MKILFIADPLHTFKIYKDTTYAMMGEMASHGIELYHTLSMQLFIADNMVQTTATAFNFIAGQQLWFETIASNKMALTDFDAVIMRTDPPFDLQYLYATQLLSLAELHGARIFNSGQAMRDYNEKLAILNFSQFTTPTLVSTQAQEIKQFLQLHHDIIIKPLDGMGGMGIFRLTEQDPNINSILETLMQLDTRTIMAQKYIAEIVKGDKRVLIINGKPLDYALARIPQGSDIRGNLAAGGKGVAQPLSPRDREIAEQLAPQLIAKGIFLAGLDIIGDYLTEVNVTSPTGFQEISQQSDCNVAQIFVQELLGVL